MCGSVCRGIPLGPLGRAREPSQASRVVMPLLPDSVLAGSRALNRVLRVRRKLVTRRWTPDRKDSCYEDLPADLRVPTVVLYIVQVKNGHQQIAPYVCKRSSTMSEVN